MNGRTAKLLRNAAGYKSQTRTPGEMPFPGIARMYQHPVYTKRLRLVRDRIYSDLGHMTDKSIHHTKMALDNRGKPIMELNTDGSVKLDMVPVSKPGVLREGSPKAIYRKLKQLAKKRILHSVMVEKQ